MEMGMSLLKQVKEKLAKVGQEFKTRAKAIAVAALGIGTTLLTKVAHAQTTIDTSSMTEMISAFLPIIMSLFAIMIPLMFFGKIMEFFERLLRSFGG